MRRSFEDGIESLQYVRFWSKLVDPLYITYKYFLVNSLSKGSDEELVVETCKRMIQSLL